MGDRIQHSLAPAFSILSESIGFSLSDFIDFITNWI